MTEPTKSQPRISLLRPQWFDFSSGAWVTAPVARRAVADRLTLVSYNLWFHKQRLQQRLRALLHLVQECSADVIGFQEVTPALLDIILAEDWIRRDYHVSDAEGGTLEPHGVLLLSRVPITDLVVCNLPSRKDRKILIGTLRAGALCVGTLHLESSPLSLPLRLKQLDQILPGLHGAENLVLMGDFNFDPRDRAEQLRIEPGYTDLWPALHGGDPGYTVDTARNRMRLLHKQKHKLARFDRILLRSVTAGWKPVSIRMLGTEPVAPECPEVYPSDHFGLAGVISRSPDVGRSG